MHKTNKTYKNIENISKVILYVMGIIIAIVFALFYLIGYDEPYEANPSLNAPLFTSLIIIVSILFIIIAIISAIYAYIKHTKIYWGEKNIVNKINKKKITSIVTLGTIVLMFITFFISHNEKIIINNKEYTNWLWLNITDMSIQTPIIQIIIGVVLIIYYKVNTYNNNK